MGADQAFETRRLLLDTQVLEIEADRLQQLMRRPPGPPAFGRRVTEKAQDRLAEHRGKVHRSAVGTNPAVAHRQGGDQPEKRLGRARQHRKFTTALRNRASLFVIAGMKGCG